jgi:hypothetical protein
MAALAGIGAMPDTIEDRAMVIHMRGRAPGEKVLSDCRTVWASEELALPTTELLTRLRAIPESPWAEYGPTGLSAMKLGAFLREFGIKSANTRFPRGQAKGYQRAEFADAWRR